VEVNGSRSIAEHIAPIPIADCGCQIHAG
jgi:hypothetical protein